MYSIRILNEEASQVEEEISRLELLGNGRLSKDDHYLYALHENLVESIRELIQKLK